MTLTIPDPCFFSTRNESKMAFFAAPQRIAARCSLLARGTGHPTLTSWPGWLASVATAGHHPRGSLQGRTCFFRAKDSEPVDHRRIHSNMREERTVLQRPRKADEGCVGVTDPPGQSILAWACWERRETLLVAGARWQCTPRGVVLTGRLS